MRWELNWKMRWRFSSKMRGFSRDEPLKFEQQNQRWDENWRWKRTKFWDEHTKHERWEVSLSDRNTKNERWTQVKWKMRSLFLKMEHWRNKKRKMNTLNIQNERWDELVCRKMRWNKRKIVKCTLKTKDEMKSLTLIYLPTSGNFTKISQNWSRRPQIAKWKKCTPDE